MTSLTLWKSNVNPTCTRLTINLIGTFSSKAKEREREREREINTYSAFAAASAHTSLTFHSRAGPEFAPDRSIAATDATDAEAAAAIAAAEEEGHDVMVELSALT